jgi:Cof subfamily protein (haloacid dehalogenase superfamily)
MTRAPDPIRLLLSDVDGTLVTHDKVLTPRAIAAVHALRRAGIGFSITSARPPRGLRMLIAPLGLTDPVAGFNGGVLATPDLEPIETLGIDPDAARRTVEMLQRHGADVWVYDADAWFVQDAKGAHVEREAWILKFGPEEVSAFSEKVLDQAIKIVGVSDDPAVMAACEADAPIVLDDSVAASRSASYFLDVTHPEANKGHVVDVLARRLGLDRRQIATIGDMPNDVLMFRQSGFSIAMGNASDAVKAEASAVTASNEDEGFAKAVEDVLLPARAGATA